MNRAIGFAVVLVIVVALIGGDATSLLRIFVLLLLLGAALHVMFRHKLPSGFWGHLALLVIGPMVLICLLSFILNDLTGVNLSVNWLWLLFIAVLIAYSWYNFHRWRNRPRRPDQFRLRGSERTFVTPLQDTRPRRDEASQSEDELWDP